MAGLIDITEALCLAVVRGDREQAAHLVKVAAAKMGAPRGVRIRRLMEQRKQMEPVRLSEMTSRYWMAVREPRAPWAPAHVLAEIEGWIEEAQHGQDLADAGERVLPLLLSGETRCGKTSVLCSVAVRLGIPVYRMSCAEVIGMHVGETARTIRSAFAEIAKGGQAGALWLVDEIDGIAGKRRGDSGADQERALGVNTILTELEQLPLGTLLAATTNRHDSMDAAVLARFNLVAFPKWDDLQPIEQHAFHASHGHQPDKPAGSYAQAVKEARRLRVQRVIAKAKESPVFKLEAQEAG